MWDLFDILSLAVRWIHAISAVLWIGGSIFYLLILRPAIRDAGRTGSPINDRFNAMVAAHYREWAHLSMMALLVSGAILTFDRLTEPSISGTYIGTLVVKIVMSFWLFGIGMAVYSRKVLQQSLAGSQEVPSRRPLLVRGVRLLISPYMVVYGGLAVLLLSDILKIAFEREIEG